MNEVQYFIDKIRDAPEFNPSRFRPFKVVFKLGSPVCVTTPWIHFDGFLSHLLLMDSLGEDFFITPKKKNLSPYLPKNKRPLPLKKTQDIFHASASIFEPESIKATRIYKRFEEQWTERLDRKNIRIGSGYFRSYIMTQPYIPAHSVTFYAFGDMELIERLIRQYIIGVGNDFRIGFGAVRSIIIEETDRDYSIVKDRKAMRAIPIDMCVEYEDAVPLAYTAPYWEPRNVKLCVPPGTRCRLKGVPSDDRCFSLSQCEAGADCKGGRQ